MVGQYATTQQISLRKTFHTAGKNIKINRQKEGPIIVKSIQKGPAQNNQEKFVR